MKRKIVGILVCMLLILTIIPVSVTSTETFGKTIYVDDDGGADYTKIQDAIDAASNGDTVYVYSGIYYENLIVNKSVIELIGEKKDTTIIDGGRNGDVINISADRIKISNFTIQNGGPLHQQYKTGIRLLYSYMNIISDNIFTSNQYSSIELKYSHDNLIMNNIFYNNCHGIMVDYSYNNKIISNQIYNNNFVGVGIYHGIGKNTVMLNNISNNHNGVSLFSTTRNMIFKNNIVSNDRGIFIYGGSGHNNIISNNFIGNANDTYFHNFMMFPRFLRQYFEIKNRFFGNYWNEPDLVIKTINCEFVINFPILILIGIENAEIVIQGVYFDLHPAKEPYDIP